MRKSLKQLVPVMLAVFLLAISNASAMTIATRFVGGTPPANMTGYGNLNDIVAAAARIWESAYADPIVVTVYYGWAPVGDAGIHTAIELDSQGKREVSGMVMFDNSGASPFYLDATPYMNEEYGHQTYEYQDLGGGRVNTARIFRNPIGPAVGQIDLLSVALHEIGHAMGMSAANSSFLSQSSKGVIQISANLPYAGTIVPIAYNNAGIVAHLDVNELAYGCLMGGVNADERRLPSALDIVTNAQISEYSILNLSAEPNIQSDSSEIFSGVRAPVLKNTSVTKTIGRASITKTLNRIKTMVISRKRR